MKKTYISPEFDFFSFELTDTQTTVATTNPFKEASANHSLIDMTQGYSDTPHEGFYFDSMETQFQ